VVFYPWKTIAPIGLLPLVPAPLRMGLAETRFLLCAVAVVGLSAALIGLRKRWPGALAAWVSYLVILAPNSGLVPIGRMFVADRYSYVATMAGYVLAAAGIAALRPLGRSRPVALAVSAVGLALVLVLIPATWRQCRAWRDTTAFLDFAETR